MATVITYRSKHDIRRDILALVSNGPKKFTHVMYEAKMSYPQIKAYLANLSADGLLQETENGISITAAGKKKLALLNEALA